MVFRSAVAPAPWTLPSHVSLLTGVDAHRHGVSRQGPIPSRIPLLAEVFRQAGFSSFRRAYETPFNLVLEARL